MSQKSNDGPKPSIVPSQACQSMPSIGSSPVAVLVGCSPGVQVGRVSLMPTCAKGTDRADATLEDFRSRLASVTISEAFPCPISCARCLSTAAINKYSCWYRGFLRASSGNSSNDLFADNQAFSKTDVQCDRRSWPSTRRRACHGGSPMWICQRQFR